MPVISYDTPDRFIAGTVGQPGARAFFLQARAGRRVTSVSLEKFQVTLLAERLEELLDEGLRLSGGTAPVPATTPVALADEEPLDQPVEEEFRVGSMALAWDPEDERIVIEAQEVTEEDDTAPEIGDEDPALAVLRVRITAGQARAFAERALKDRGSGPPAVPAVRASTGRARHVCPGRTGT